MQKVTINDVAGYAGVSKKTVSRVLNKEPNVSETTLQKVKAAFIDLSYKPSPQARGLASNQSFLIGLLYDNPNKSYVSDIQTGALSVCNKDGYHLIIHPTDHESTNLLNNLQNFISQSQLDGLVLTPPFSDMTALIDMLNKNQIPYVRIGATLLDTKSCCVTNNDEEAAFEITQHLISLGHTDIAFIKGHPDHNVSNQRLAGYCKALEHNGITINKQYIVQGYFDFNSGEKSARKLLTLEQPPTAIFASNDYMAAGAMKVANQKNISVPHDLSLAGFDDAQISLHIWPSLTTVQQPIIEMTTQAVTMLIKIIRKEDIEEMQKQLNSTLVVRESTAPVVKKMKLA